MKPFYLSEITTKDGLIHQGIFFKPQKSGKKALLWIHGLMGKFYGNVRMTEILIEQCEKEGFGFAAFNNRGHDMITSTHKTDQSYANIGAGREIFEECVFDIDAAVKFLIKQGFSEVFIAGMSTGANKACYYGATQKNLAGIVLLSPISDRLNPAVSVKWYTVLYIKLLIALGRGDVLITQYSFFPGTPNRFLSLIASGSKEDIFDYGNKEPILVRFSSIQKPMLILFGGIDQYADRPVSTIKKVFDSHHTSPSYQSVIIQDANHGFEGKEKEVVHGIISWIKTIS